MHSRTAESTAIVCLKGQTAPAKRLDSCAVPHPHNPSSDHDQDEELSSSDEHSSGNAEKRISFFVILLPHAALGRYFSWHFGRISGHCFDFHALIIYSFFSITHATPVQLAHTLLQAARPFVRGGRRQLPGGSSDLSFFRL